MELSTTQRLKMYIEDEERDAIFYKELSNIAPNTKFRELLFEMAIDEQIHADSFKRIYRAITGRTYSPIITPQDLSGGFINAIKKQILEESEGYRKYSEQYLINEKNKALKEAYFRAKTDENVHALRLLYMLLPV